MANYLKFVFLIFGVLCIVSAEEKQEVNDPVTEIDTTVVPTKLPPGKISTMPPLVHTTTAPTTKATTEAQKGKSGSEMVLASHVLLVFAAVTVIFVSRL